MTEDLSFWTCFRICMNIL